MSTPIGAHRRAGTVMPPARDALAPARLANRGLGGDQDANPFDQGELIAMLSRQFSARWGSGVCRILVGQWLAAGGEIDETYFAIAQQQLVSQFRSGDRDKALDTRNRLEALLDSQMKAEREDMFDNFGLTVVASMDRSPDPSDVVSFTMPGGLFYLRLASADDRYAHAVGLVVGQRLLRLFDPNTKTVDGGIAVYRHLQRILAGWRHQPPYLVRYEAFKLASG
jgi:hypothetical protein